VTRTELIDTIKNTPTRQMLHRLGYHLTTRDTRFHPCPSCKQGVKGERDRGNVSIHSSGFGWHCYTCGEGGSNLDLLLQHHDLPRQLADDAFACMRDFLGDVESPLPAPPPATQPAPPMLTPAQIRGWCRNMQGDPSLAHRWLSHDRGIQHPDDRLYRVIGTPRQLPVERPDLREAVAAHPGGCVAFPLFSLAGDVCNVVIRPIVPHLPAGQSRPWKARTLNAGSGTTRANGLPLVYGNPLAVASPRLIVIVEGALDHLTAACMSPRDVLVLGAFCADDIPHLAGWCAQQSAPIVAVPHLDETQTRCQACRLSWAKLSKRPVTCSHSVETRHPGEDACAALQAACPHVQLFDWHGLLSWFGLTPETYRPARSDLNDLIRRDIGDPITTMSRLAPIWCRMLERY
jgi:hypothetical protein